MSDPGEVLERMAKAEWKADTPGDKLRWEDYPAKEQYTRGIHAALQELWAMVQEEHDKSLEWQIGIIVRDITELEL